MNEHIERMAREAGFILPSGHSIAPKEMMEAFARLIVEDCAAEAKSYFSGGTAAQAIRERYK